MKKAIIVLIFAAVSFTANAQNAKVTADGNFVALKSSTEPTPGKPTNKTFTDSKGKVYPVLESKNGKLYYIRTSKAGNEYRCYIKTEPATP